ncbi:MAG: hypothetical protein HYU41_19610 [Candidatus Rokubacteria bacterium]|nr:hypothetical protein [Candidatus Rokubacteria bacterium]
MDTVSSQRTGPLGAGLFVPASPAVDRPRAAGPAQRGAYLSLAVTCVTLAITFGAIFGAAQIGSALGSALGAWLAGRLFDATGGYGIALVVAAVTAAVAGTLIWIARAVRTWTVPAPAVSAP